MMLYPPSQQMRKIIHASKFSLLPLRAKSGNTQPHYNMAGELLGREYRKNLLENVSHKTVLTEPSGVE